LDVLTAEQLAEWQAFDEIEPIWDAEKEDIRQGHLMSFLDNSGKAVHGKRGSIQWSKPSDFILRWNHTKQEKPEQTAEQQKSILMAFAATTKSKKKKSPRRPIKRSKING
jgi:hypothetical protein